MTMNEKEECEYCGYDISDCQCDSLPNTYLKKCKKEDRSCHDFIARYLFVNHRKKYDELTKEYESGTNAYPDGEELE